MSAVWVRVLCLILVGWFPLNFAAELLRALPSIALRGPFAFLELLGHGIVAALCVAAGMSLWNRSPHGRAFAMMALVLAALAAVQNLYWSVLPSQIMPGDELPLALFATAHSAFWLTYLHRADGSAGSPARSFR